MIETNLSSAMPVSYSASSFDQQTRRIRAALIQNGFSEKEALVYLNLLTNGEAKAGDLAREVKLHRLDVYNALKNLQAREIVTSTMTKPMLFRAAPLTKVIDIVKEDRNEDLRRKTVAINELSESGRIFDELINANRRPEDFQRRTTDQIQILTGRKSIAEKWEKYLSSAASEFLVVTTERGTMQLLLLQSLDVLSSRVRKDRLVVKIFTPVRSRDFSALQDSGLLIRDLVAQNSAGMCIVDNEEVLMVTRQTEEHARSQAEENAVVIKSTSIVGMIRTLFFVGWDTSPTLEEAGRRLKREYSS